MRLHRNEIEESFQSWIARAPTPESGATRSSENSAAAGCSILRCSDREPASMTLAKTSNT